MGKTKILIFICFLWALFGTAGTAHACPVAGRKKKRLFSLLFPCLVFFCRADYGFDGITAKEWRDKNPGKEGNVRDYSSVEQLVCLSNLESMNAIFIKKGATQSKRLQLLNEVAIDQMKTLLRRDGGSIKKLK